MQFLVLCVCIAIVFAAAEQSWKIIDGTKATTLIGLGAASERLGVGASASNGIGAFNQVFDGENWNKNIIPGAGLLLDSAVTKDGVVVSTSIFNVYISTDGGKSYTVAEGIQGSSQSANVFGPNQDRFALVGSFLTKTSKGPSSVAGVAISEDSGLTWRISQIDVPVGYARYGAFPSDKVWYVSNGIWADSASVDGEHRLSRGYTVTKSGVKQSMPVRSVNETVTATGWFGSIQKTTDGGLTWSEVFSIPSSDLMYFNAISCSSETQCVAVAEGDAATGGYRVAAYTTTDGGLTWTQTLDAPDVGLMGAYMTSSTEGWLAGSVKSRVSVDGKFWVTNDGAKTWSVQQTLSNCMVMDLDFGNQVGYASCAQSGGANCVVAMYV